MSPTQAVNDLACSWACLVLLSGLVLHRLREIENAQRGLEKGAGLVITFFQAALAGSALLLLLLIFSPAGPLR